MIGSTWIMFPFLDQAVVKGLLLLARLSHLPALAWAWDRQTHDRQNAERQSLREEAGQVSRSHRRSIFSRELLLFASESICHFQLFIILMVSVSVGLCCFALFLDFYPNSWLADSLNAQVLFQTLRLLHLGSAMSKIIKQVSSFLPPSPFWRIFYFLFSSFCLFTKMFKEIYLCKRTIINL